jgi:D-3-phosphoglycerate dehydrogenase / 2-oxoglutarate reductase
MKRALITDGVDPLLIEGLENLGYSCDYFPNISLAQTIEMIEPYEGLIINSKIIVDKRFLDKAVHLKFLGRLGSGMEIIDQDYAVKKGVAVFSAPEGNCNAVAEHALGMLLALANNMLRADRQVRQKIWEREQNRGFELMGKTIGIIGFGHTGSAFAGKLSGMGMRVLAYDKYKKDYASNYPHVIESEMEELFQKADILSFHLPLTEEVIHLVDEDYISKCKKRVILINTSRGKVIKTAALINGLDNGNIKGACLDVFENEKPLTFTKAEELQFARLYSFDQVILSPHIAGWTLESKRRLAAILLEKISGRFRNQY